MYCCCGCGGVTPIAERTRRSRGVVKGTAASISPRASNYSPAKEFSKIIRSGSVLEQSQQGRTGHLSAPDSLLDMDRGAIAGGLRKTKPV